MKHILVTGATGFIGKDLVLQLSSLDCDVACLSRSIPAWANDLNNISWIRGELALTDAVHAQITEFAPDTIMHLAWQGIPDYSFETSSLNESLTKFFFEAILDAIPIKKVIVTGSCWEVGSVTGAVSPEEWHPVNDFTRAKHAIHQFLSMRAEEDDFDLIWARLFYVFGPGQKSRSLVPMMMQHLLSTGQLPELREPKNAHDFIFLRDVSFALISLINHPNAKGMFNIGSGRAYNVSAISHYLLALHDGRMRDDERLSSQQLASQPLEGGDASTFWADISSLTAVTGWTPQYSIEKGLVEALNWYKVHFNA